MYSLILDCEHPLRAVCSNRHHVIRHVPCLKMLEVCNVDIEYKQFLFLQHVRSEAIPVTGLGNL
jgi:hypothetical protein